MEAGIRRADRITSVSKVQVTDYDMITEYHIRRSEWSKALKSGTYKQGTGSLVFVPEEKEFRESEYCCLGVACMLFKDKIGLITYRADESEHSYCIGFADEDKEFFEGGLSSYVILTPKSKKFLGLSDDSVRILTTLNDRGVGFPVIADVLNNLPYEMEDLTDDES